MQFPPNSEQNVQSIDRFIFSGGLVLLIVIVGTILIAPQWSATAIDTSYVFI